MSDPKPAECMKPARLQSLDFIMRDGGIRVTYSFISSSTSADWFGIFSRVNDGIPLAGSHMVYIRFDGRIELATYPDSKVAVLGSAGEQTLNEQQELAIEFENDFLTLKMQGVTIEKSVLTYQRAGQVILAAHDANVKVVSAETICRDTIEWDHFG